MNILFCNNKTNFFLLPSITLPPTFHFDDCILSPKLRFVTNLHFLVYLQVGLQRPLSVELAYYLTLSLRGNDIRGFKKMYLRWLFEFIKLNYNIELRFLLANEKKRNSNFSKIQVILGQNTPGTK